MSINAGYLMTEFPTSWYHSFVLFDPMDHCPVQQYLSKDLLKQDQLSMCVPELWKVKKKKNKTLTQQYILQGT